MDALPLTGERTVPGVPSENYWFRRHEAAYVHAAGLIGGRTLEVGCGEGYGTALLSAHAELVGIDYDATTVAHAAREYPTARFVRGNLAALPIASGSCDAVVSLQVVEHVWDHPQFVRECRRVLRPDGLLLLTTPNRLTFSPGLDTPVNPFHTHEFTADELAALVASCGFTIERVAGLFAGSRLRELDARWGGSFVAAQLVGPPDEWDEQLRLAVASVGTDDFVLADGDIGCDIGCDIDGALDLVLVARAR